MSHFTVLVVGDDIEKQLQPFHEFECTGVDDEYVVDVDKTEGVRTRMKPKEEGGPGESLQEALSYWGWEDKIVRDEAEVKRGGAHKYGYAVVTDDGVLVKAVARTNPNAEWDWWRVGGRWTGFFTLKPGTAGERGRPGLMTDAAPPGTADRCRKGDVDMLAMRQEARCKAAERFDLYERVTAGLPPAKSWEQVRTECEELAKVDPASLGGKSAIEVARERYHAQPLVQACRADRALWSIDCPVEEFGMGRDAYLAAAESRAGRTFAILHNGRWIERGDMGWWGCVRDEKPDGEWAQQFREFWDSLPDDVMVTVVDCHI